MNRDQRVRHSLPDGQMQELLRNVVDDAKEMKQAMLELCRECKFLRLENEKLRYTQHELESTMAGLVKKRCEQMPNDGTGAQKKTPEVVREFKLCRVSDRSVVNRLVYPPPVAGNSRIVRPTSPPRVSRELKVVRRRKNPAFARLSEPSKSRVKHQP